MLLLWTKCRLRLRRVVFLSQPLSWLCWSLCFYSFSFSTSFLNQEEGLKEKFEIMNKLSAQDSKNTIQNCIQCLIGELDRFVNHLSNRSNSTYVCKISWKDFLQKYFINCILNSCLKMPSLWYKILCSELLLLKERLGSLAVGYFLFILPSS